MGCRSAGSILAPLGSVGVELVALAAMTVIATVAMATRRTVGRLEATVMLLGYVTFLSALALR